MLYGLGQECSNLYTEYLELSILCFQSIGDFVALSLIPFIIIIVTKRYMSDSTNDEESDDEK